MVEETVALNRPGWWWVGSGMGLAAVVAMVLAHLVVEAVAVEVVNSKQPGGGKWKKILKFIFKVIEKLSLLQTIIGWLPDDIQDAINTLILKIAKWLKDFADLGLWGSVKDADFLFRYYPEENNEYEFGFGRSTEESGSKNFIRKNFGKGLTRMVQFISDECRDANSYSCSCSQI